MKKAILLAVACAFAAAASAQQYKWTDKNGRVQYGDAPPPGVKATPLRPPPPAPAAAAKRADPKAAGKGLLTPAEKDAEYRKRQAEAAKDRDKLAKDQQAAEAKKENCARAQDYLRNLQSGQRLSGVDSKGERYYLDEAQIAQETAKAQQGVQQWCK
ncbi:MAG: DUF4124 domain-containing protein [Betaproteobacteria bacterium]|nr:MAG: DUF4124 domain-containing protein [Betaproteobacteria bacterium]